MSRLILKIERRSKQIVYKTECLMLEGCTYVDEVASKRVVECMSNKTLKYFSISSIVCVQIRHLRGIQFQELESQLK